jgi:hypothetical protein
MLSTEIKEDTTRADRLFFYPTVIFLTTPTPVSIMQTAHYGFPENLVTQFAKRGQITIWVKLILCSVIRYIYADLLQAMDLFNKMKRPAGVSNVQYLIGGIYEEMSDSQQALQYYFEARKMVEENRRISITITWCFYGGYD